MGASVLRSAAKSLFWTFTSSLFGQFPSQELNIYAMESVKISLSKEYKLRAIDSTKTECRIAHTKLSWLIWVDIFPLQKTLHGHQWSLYSILQWSISQIVCTVHIHTPLLDQPLDDLNVNVQWVFNGSGQRSVPVSVLMVQHCFSFLAHLQERKKVNFWDMQWQSSISGPPFCALDLGSLITSECQRQYNERLWGGKCLDYLPFLSDGPVL